MSRTLYDILEVAKTAPPEVIKSAYRSLAAIYHPDSGQSPDEEKFKRIARAYEVLSDPEKRSEYDARILHEEEDKFLGFATDDESLAPKTVKRVDGTDTWCTIDEHVRRKGAELAEADLNGLKLRGLSLKKAQLKGADLSNADIKNVDLSESNLESVTCKNGIFEQVDFSKTKLDYACFERCIFKKCKFSGHPHHGSAIKNSSFVSSDISNHIFENLSFYDVNFSDSCLENSSFCMAKDSSVNINNEIKDCNMKRANLRYTKFCSNIYNVNFSNSNMEYIEGSSAEYKQCNFKNTNLAYAKLKECVIKKPWSFEGANLFNADLSFSKIIRSDFSTCNLINTRFHEANLVDVIFPVDYKLPSSAIVKTSSQERKELNFTSNTTPISRNVPLDAFRLPPQGPNHGRSREGCYIATMIYGNYDALQVVILRQFRDRYLKKTTMGRCFIKIYYNIAPLLIKYVGHCKLFQAIVKYILDRLVKKIS